MNAWTAALSTVLLLSHLIDGPAAVESSLGARVRSSHPYLHAMIDEASLRSTTFNGLVKEIEASNGIVYVEHGSCSHAVRACLTLNLTAAGNYRILWVVVDARQPDWDVMASIGHELAHALEVLRNPALKSTADVYQFYAQGRQASSRLFETTAAIEAGFAVRREVSSFARASLN